MVLATDVAWAEKRVALIVGNSTYQTVPQLPNPARDASSVAKMFKDAGFDSVDVQLNVGNLEFKRAIRKFEVAADQADIAVVYYAGHGLEIAGTNYLIPTDARLASDRDADDEAILLERLVASADGAKRLRLVILDACRDNPFVGTMRRERRTASRAVLAGLGKVEPTSTDTLIAYAAKAGSTADDGDGLHSPFTNAVLKFLTVPGLDVRLAFGRVRDEVLRVTGNRQEPFVYGSLGGNDVALVPAPAAAPADHASTDLRRDYELAERVGTREAWDSFIRANPAGFYSDLARAQRNKLAAEAARIAATEKARAAEEERARLAAEGAKAAELAKAAAQSKAAEEARLAAEKKKRIEDEKLATVERAKAAEQQKQAAEEARKLEATRLATLSPSDTSPAPQDIPRLLQSELKRVGCNAGAVDGEWNASSRRALASFNDKAGTKFDVKLASIDALDAVRAKTGRVCPLECARGTRASGDSCVKITCDDGYVLGADGACQKRPKVVQKRRAPASAGRGRCFAFNGKQVCE